MKYFKLLLVGILFIACQQKKSRSADTKLPVQPSSAIEIKYAKGFEVEKKGDITIIKVTNAWPGSTESFIYALIPREKLASITLARDAYDAIIATPVNKIVVTSTTHIPSLEALGVETRLVGFPETKYVSSEKTRKNIESGTVVELGKNESINTEVLINLSPEVVVGFTVNDNNKAYENIQKSGIAVVFNGDWVEETPLGKAEWIKFFAPFFQLETKAKGIFNDIESEYNDAKQIALNAKNKPSVMSGAMFKDVWYLPAGDSWAAQFLKDANANYIWKDSKGTGSLSLSIESVLDKAKDADYWVGPSGYTSYKDLNASSVHYQKFNAFNKKKIITFGLTKGSTGGLQYYELGPNRPDIILKDLIHILHPELLPDYKPYFFKPLND